MDIEKIMRAGEGNRADWEFEYTASKLAEGATAQQQFRLGRVLWWKDAKDKVMAEVRDSGLEISESMAAQIGSYANTSMNGPQIGSYANTSMNGPQIGSYANTSMNGPQISVRADLQRKLAECHSKIQTHQQAADEYEGWIQVLKANSEARLKLTHSDWLYFFGKV